MDAETGDDTTPPLGPGMINARRVGGVEDDPGFKRRPGYAKARDRLVEAFVEHRHEPELWRAFSRQAEWSGEVAIVRCRSCRYVVVVNPTLPRLNRYRGATCSKQFAEQVLDEQQRVPASEREARRTMLAVVMVMPVIIVRLMTATTTVTEESTLVFLVPVVFSGVGAWGAWTERRDGPPAG